MVTEVEGEAVCGLVKSERSGSGCVMAEGSGGDEGSEGLVDLSSGGDEAKFFIRRDE